MPFTTFVAGTESQTFGATGTGTVLLNLLPHDLLIVTVAHIGNGTEVSSITNNTGVLTSLSQAAVGGAFNDHDVYIETWYLDNALGFLGVNDVLTFNFTGNPNDTQIIYRVVRANAGDINWHLDVSSGSFGQESPADTANATASIDPNEFFYAALQVFHQVDLAGAWGGGFTDGTEQIDPIFDENVVLNDGYLSTTAIGTYNATKVIDNNAFGPEWGTTLCSFYYTPRPICDFPYRTIIVQDAIFPANTFATVRVPRGIVRAVTYAYGRGGGGGESGEGGGCGGFAIDETILDPVFPDTIPVNVTDAGTDSGGAYGGAGGTPQGGTATGDYTINGGMGSPSIDEGFGNYSGGIGCGGAAGGIWDGDTNGEDGQGIGAGGGGAGGNTETSGTPGQGGPGLGIVQLCAGLGWQQKIHRRHNTGQTNNSISHNTPLNQYTTTTGIGLRRKPIIAAGLAGPFPPTLIPSPSPQPCSDPENFDVVYNLNQPFKQQTFVNGNNFTWVAPYGVYEIILQIQGNGEGGAQGGDDFGGCGGNGGECSYYIVSVIPGQSYPIVIDGTGIDFNSGEIFVAGDTSPQPGPTCDLGPPGEDGGPPECPGAGGLGGAGGNDYGIDGEDGTLGGGGGGGGAAGATGGFGGEGWVRVFYVNQFGRRGGYSTQRYPTANHQTHQTGQTNSSISHCVPLNQWTTSKGISTRNKPLMAAALVPPPPIPPPPPICGHPISVNLTSGSGNWTVPEGVHQIYVECYGPGGNGGDGGDFDGHYGGSGGGGGGYGASLLNVTPGDVFAYTVGTPGFTTDFGFLASGGPGNDGQGSTGVPNLAGGDGGTGFGDVAFDGGTGGESGAVNSEIAGGGGGCAGPGGNGSDGGNPSGGSGSGAFAGNGGDGGSFSAGNPGFVAGGGGGGGTGFNDPTTFPGGAGANGLITITHASTFGQNGNFHQTHSTQSTNFSIQHCQGMNNQTTTKGIGFRRKWFLAAILAAFPEPAPTPPPVLCGNYITTDYIPSSETINTTWTAPPGVTSVRVQCQGAGANGNGGATSITEGWPGGGGGGAGGYAESIVPVIPGNTYTISVGGPGSESDTNFDFTVVGNAGFATLGGSGTGDIVINGADGFPGVGWVPPLTFSTGGNGGDSPTGGFGGNGGQGDNSVGAGGGNGGFGAGGGGGGGGADVGGPGGLGGPGWMRISIPGFGNRHIAHQTHTTGQTSNSISHNCPINQFTTTKGIGMRRKWAFTEDSPQPTPFTAPLYSKYVLYAAGLAAADIPQPTPFTAPLYTKYTLYAAGLAAADIPDVPPNPPFCGRMIQASFTESQNWTVPAKVTEIYVECISGGGGGGDGSAGNNSGGGGGGAAYAASLLNVTPATTYPVQVGIGGTGNGIDGTVSDFNSGQVSADFGVGATGSSAGTGGLAANSTGDIVLDGIDGYNGVVGSPVSGGDGGAAPGGGTGGAGGTPSTAGSPGGYPGGGAGGGGSTFGVGGGATGANGLVKITWPSTYGLRGDIHQTHSTGQTNYSIMHCTPLNQYTTTKGIGMRRKYILDVNPSDLRVTQEYAEVFNVDPPNPLEQITQFFFEVMDQPPPQAGWTADIYRGLTIIAAALAEPEPPPPPPEPFTAQAYLRQVYIGAALAASLPGPTPPAPSPCNCACVTTCTTCASSGACPPWTVTYGQGSAGN